MFRIRSPNRAFSIPPDESTLAGNGAHTLISACRKRLRTYNSIMVTVQEDKELQDRARALLGRISEARADAKLPLVVEFAGSPKAGKTTNIDIVTHFFKRTSFKTWAPTEGASKRTPYYLRRDLVAFNAWALNYAISEILTAYHNVEEYDLVVLDRGPFDSLAWMRVLRDDGKLTPDEYSRIQDFAQHPKWARLVERVYLFTCSPDTSMHREHEAKLIRSEGTAMNEEMLGKLHEQYSSLGTDSDTDNPSILKISTDDGGDGPRHTARQIATDIMDLLERKVEMEVERDP